MAMALAEPPWPPSLSPLKAVDDLLRCGICFDYFSIAMIIPQCSHNYCSLCIRKFLSYKTQCPTCCVAVSESDLKNNRTLDELVKSFNSASSVNFSTSQSWINETGPVVSCSAGGEHRAPAGAQQHVACSSDDLHEAASSGDVDTSPGCSLCSAALTCTALCQEGETVCCCCRQQLLQLVLDSPPSPSPLACSRHPAGKSHVKSPASWPAAEEKVPLIDSFLKKEEKVCILTEAEGLAGAEQIKTEEEQTLCSSSTEADGKDNRGSQQSPEGTKSHEKPSTSVLKAVRKVGCPVCEVAIPEQYINKHLDSCLTRDEKKDSLRSSAQKRKPLSKVVYNLLSDRDLKKKLREHGLSTRGTRQQLVRRHRDFVHLYNAQCDSLHPKPVAEIVKELESSEKIRVQLEFKSGENSLTFTKDQTEEEIDEIHTEYRNKHRREFQVLVDQVNDRWKKSSKGKPESAQNTEVVTDKELPAATEHRGEHCTADVPEKAQAEAPDGQSEPPSLQEGQRSVSPAPSLSSTSSSSSDILRDPSEPEITSVSSDSDSFQGLRVSKRRPRGPQEPEAKQLLPKSKRKKS